MLPEPYQVAGFLIPLAYQQDSNLWVLLRGAQWDNVLLLEHLLLSQEVPQTYHQIICVLELPQFL